MTRRELCDTWKLGTEGSIGPLVPKSRQVKSFRTLAEEKRKAVDASIANHRYTCRATLSNSNV
jgi:hypothetical protein